MKLKVINSGSTGNCYILESERHILILECGVPFFEIKKALGFKLNKVVGCLMTHEHKDHSLCAKEMMNSGIKIYSTKGTFEALGLIENPNAIEIDKYELIKSIPMFSFMALKSKHDCKDPVIFVINHHEMGTTLFATDTKHVIDRIEGLSNIIIEANYCEDIVREKSHNGTLNVYVDTRTMQNHMSLQTAITALKFNDISKVNNIVLCHLSDRNTHEKRFKEQVQKATLKTVNIATPGLEINFNKTPF